MALQESERFVIRYYRGLVRNIPFAISRHAIDAVMIRIDGEAIDYGSSRMAIGDALSSLGYIDIGTYSVKSIGPLVLVVGYVQIQNISRRTFIECFSIGQIANHFCINFSIFQFARLIPPFLMWTGTSAVEDRVDGPFSLFSRQPPRLEVVPRDEVLDHGAEVAISKDEVSNQGEEVAIDKAKVAGPSDGVAVSKDGVAAKGDKVTIDGDEVAVQRGPVAPQGDMADAQEDEVASQGDEVAVQRDPVAPQGDIVDDHGAEVDAQGDEVALQGDEVANQGDDELPGGNQMLSLRQSNVRSLMS